MSSPSALGARWDGASTRFALYSDNATAVELCFFDHPQSASESRRLRLERSAAGVWALDVPDAGPGTLYGYRVHGPYEPHHGHRFNPAKLLLDPYARALTGEPALSRALYGFDPESSARASYNGEDSAAAMPKCVVVDPAFDWGDDRPPRTPWSETVIYEAHVKGMSARHPEVDEALRGTYLGLAEPPILEHLVSLGVTAVELMPVHQIASEPALLERGLGNYWGYSPLGFFAPHAGYAQSARGEQVAEFQMMVRELHRAGLEVILDVVLNHTAEGGHRGRTLSLRGIDNRAYYRLDRDRPWRYDDVSGCGNTLDAASPAVERLVLDCLRHWALEMHVDGFRFDLATTLGRTGRGFDREAPLLEAIGRDPVLSRVKLIAEPWDLGPGGYRLGGFPHRWREWNDRFRDAARRFWRGDGAAPELARRIAASPDLFDPARKEPLASVNFVVSHDGFTLADLVSYERKHNLANGEDNRDGSDHDLSRNWGHEGPTDDPGIRALRERARRNLVATLAFSRGVPMIRHGDELGHTQDGNNNPYPQDNEIGWLDWATADRDLLAFFRQAFALRRRHRTLRQASPEAPPIRWLTPEGHEAPLEHLSLAFAALLPPLPDADVEPDPELLWLANGTPDPVVFTLPAGAPWRLELATGGAERRENRLELEGFSSALLSLS